MYVRAGGFGQLRSCSSGAITSLAGYIHALNGVVRVVGIIIMTLDIVSTT